MAEVTAKGDTGEFNKHVLVAFLFFNIFLKIERKHIVVDSSDQILIG